jgi:hypothetical protein
VSFPLPNHSQSPPPEMLMVINDPLNISIYQDLTRVNISPKNQSINQHHEMPHTHIHKLCTHALSAGGGSNSSSSSTWCHHHPPPPPFHHLYQRSGLHLPRLFLFLLRRTHHTHWPTGHAQPVKTTTGYPPKPRPKAPNNVSI